MRRMISMGFSFLLLVSCLPQVSSGQPLHDAIDRVVTASPIADKRLGLWIGWSTGAKSIYEKNANRSFIPASLAKLVTAAAVFKHFPAGHTFQTQLRTRGSIKQQVLTGDLIFKGGGDPAFVSEKMWLLVNHLIRTGVQTISGNIVVDDLLFDQERFTSERDSRRVDRAYDAPVGALSFNWNSVTVYVRPGLKIGQPARVMADPVNEYIQVENQTSTIKGKTAKLSIYRKTLRSNPQPNDIIKIQGTIGRHSKERLRYVNIRLPGYWSALNLKSFLSQRGIGLTGRVQIAQKDTGGRLLAEVNSWPIEDIVKAMMKFSNNFISEMLTKHLAVKVFGPPGNMGAGLRVIRAFLKDAGISQIHVADSSGLSRQNRITPSALAHLLNTTLPQFPIGPEYLVTLPISGIDGTLKRRMRADPAKGWVRAKTGRLNGVIGLAGYAGSRSGQVFTFVFIYNGQSHQMGAAQALFDQLATILVRQ